MHPIAANFIYASSLAVSHITITLEEPEVIAFGLYATLLPHHPRELVLQCDFAQINDLLGMADYVADEIIEELADVLSTPTGEPHTIDVTGTGGINFNELLFCLQPLLFDENGDHFTESEFGLYAFIKKDASIPVSTSAPETVDKQSELKSYLTALSIQYDFYLHFSRLAMEPSEAMLKAGLQNEVVFKLARTGYELRQCQNKG